MANRKNAAEVAAWVVVVACMATAVAAADSASKEMMDFCAATGFEEHCMDANITQAKEFIKKAFDAAVAEIQIVIKNTTVYKEIESDKMTRGALDVCERVLQSSIDEIKASMDQIMKFEVGQMDKSLDVVQIWISAAITFKDTCYDAFAKTKGKSRPIVRDMLKTSGRLLSKGMALVIEFQKAFQSISKDLGSLINRIKSRQLLNDNIDDDIDDDQVPDFVGGHARKLVENPKISLPPNSVVAQDGSGNFKTITEAVNAVPTVDRTTPFVIKVKAGVYKEYVVIPKGVDEVIIVGDGPLNTRITGNKSFKDGVQTYDSATLSVDGRGFIAKDIGIENTAGPIGEQAVAVRISGDVAVFYNVHFDAYQDTLYAHVQRQLFRECRVSGTIDFIFGNGISVFQKCQLVVRKPNPNQEIMVTAQGRNEKNITGITIIQGCNITAETDFLDAKPPFKAFLGRPWKHLSRTVILQTTIEGFIDPLGWAMWPGVNYKDTLFYVEYNNYGARGENPTGRVDWPGFNFYKSDDQARPWTPLVHFKEDQWIYDSGVPYAPEFI